MGVAVGLGVADLVGTGMGEVLGDALAVGFGVDGDVDWLGAAELLAVGDGECLTDPMPPP